MSRYAEGEYESIDVLSVVEVGCPEWDCRTVVWVYPEEVIR